MANPVFAHDHQRSPTALFPTDAGETPIVNQDELLHRYPGALGGKTGFTNIAARPSSARLQRNGRRLIVVQMFGLDKPGGPTYLGSGDRACSTGVSRKALRPASGRCSPRRRGRAGSPGPGGSAPRAPVRGSSAKQIDPLRRRARAPAGPATRRASQHAAPNASVGLIPTPLSASTSSAMRPCDDHRRRVGPGVDRHPGLARGGDRAAGTSRTGRACARRRSGTSPRARRCRGSCRC